MVVRGVDVAIIETLASQIVPYVIDQGPVHGQDFVTAGFSLLEHNHGFVLQLPFSGACLNCGGVR